MLPRASLPFGRGNGAGPAPFLRLLENLAAGRAQTLVAYGTSLTAGGRWVTELQAWLDARHPGLAKVINSGISGRASNTALAKVEELVVAHRPDLVFIEFAINDAALFPLEDRDHGIAPAQSRANLHRLLDTILAARPSAELVLQTMNPAWDAPNGKLSSSRRPFLTEYYEGYRQVARERTLPLLDHHAAWSRLRDADPTMFERYVADGVHPTDEGSTAITWAAIRHALESVPGTT